MDKYDLEFSSDETSDQGQPMKVDDIMYDGTGNTIHIPSIITSKSHGQKLMNMYLKT